MEEGGPKVQTPHCRTVCPGNASNPAVGHLGRFLREEILRVITRRFLPIYSFLLSFHFLVPT